MSNKDYGANILIENYPDGQDIEVFKFSALEAAWNGAKLLSEREHVTPYIRNNSDLRGGSLFTAINYPCDYDFSKIRMTVDEIRDFELIKKLINDLGIDKTWVEYTNYIIQNTSSVTQINSASFLSPVFSYVGKRIRITNQQSTPIVFKHNFGAGELKFDLINDNDFILGTDETINLIIQDDYTLLHVAEINTDNLPIPTLQQVTDAGNFSSNVIVANNGITTSDFSKRVFF